MTAMTNRDAVIQSNLARIGYLEERIKKLYGEYNELIGMVQDLVEVVNGGTKIVEDIGARLKDGEVAVEDFEARIARLEANAGITTLP